MEVQEPSNISINDCDIYFMSLAEELTKSNEDQHIVGACIVKDNKALSFGYSDVPKSLQKELVPFTSYENDNILNQRDTFICHAIPNAIFSYKGRLSDLEDATIYTTDFPCYECAKILVNVGIKEVVYKEVHYRAKIYKASKYILDKCGIKVRKIGEQNDN